MRGMFLTGDDRWRSQPTDKTDAAGGFIPAAAERARLVGLLPAPAHRGRPRRQLAVDLKPTRTAGCLRWAGSRRGGGVLAKVAGNLAAVRHAPCPEFVSQKPP